MGAARKKAAPERKAESRTVEYLPAGVATNPYEGNEPTLDPELAKIREQEAKSNAEVKVEPRQEPTIDDALVKARKAELERDAKRAGVTLSDTSAGKAEAKSEPKSEPAPKSSK